MAKTKRHIYDIWLLCYEKDPGPVEFLETTRRNTMICEYRGQMYLTGVGEAAVCGQQHAPSDCHYRRICLFFVYEALHPDYAP